MYILEVCLLDTVPSDKREGWISRPRDGDVGYDLRTCIDFKLDSFRTIKIPTGITLHLKPIDHPIGHPLCSETFNLYYGQIFDRSSMGLKGIKVMGGVIDPAYRGEICVVLANLGANQFSFSVGDKVAQLVFMRFGTFDVAMVDRLDDSKRGSSGFGSTGIS